MFIVLLTVLAIKTLVSFRLSVENKKSKYIIGKGFKVVLTFGIGRLFLVFVLAIFFLYQYPFSDLAERTM